MHTESDTNELIGGALRALPADDAQPCSWLEFQCRQAQAVRTSPIGIPQLALAALAVAAVAFLAVWARLDHKGAATADLIAAAPARAGTGDESRAAERWLASLPREPAIVRVGTRSDVLRLEDRIAQVDDLLTAGRAGRIEATHLVALQRERAQLVSALARVRYAETLADELP